MRPYRLIALFLVAVLAGCSSSRHMVHRVITEIVDENEDSAYALKHLIDRQDSGLLLDVVRAAEQRRLKEREKIYAFAVYALDEFSFLLKSGEDLSREKSRFLREVKAVLETTAFELLTSKECEKQLCGIEAVPRNAHRSLVLLIIALALTAEDEAVVERAIFSLPMNSEYLASGLQVCMANCLSRSKNIRKAIINRLLLYVTYFKQVITDEELQRIAATTLMTLLKSESEEKLAKDAVGVLLKFGGKLVISKLFALIKDPSITDVSRRAALKGVLSLGNTVAHEALLLYMWKPMVYVAPTRFTHVRIRDEIYRYFLECEPVVKVHCLPFVALVTPEHAKECNRQLSKLVGRDFDIEEAHMHPEKYYIIRPFVKWFLSNRPYLMYSGNKGHFVVDQKAKEQKQPIDIRSGQKLTPVERNQLDSELRSLKDILDSWCKKSRISPLPLKAQNTH